MEQRYLTKTLWAAAIVIMAIGALGQDVLAQKKSRTCELTTVIVSCGPKGFVEADATTLVRIPDDSAEAVMIETKLDTLTGRSCYSVQRELATTALIARMDKDISLVPTENGMVFRISFGWAADTCNHGG